MPICLFTYLVHCKYSFKFMHCGIKNQNLALAHISMLYNLFVCLLFSVVAVVTFYLMNYKK